MSHAATAQQDRFGFDSAGMVLTPAEFDAVTQYDEQYRYELVHGVLVVNPIPGASQAGPNDMLGYLLNRYKFSHPQGDALDDTLPERYIRTRDSRRLADRVIWAGLGKQPRPTDDLPAIAVEFVSAGKRNRQRNYEHKRDEYLDVGVLEYWIIDRFERRMTVYRNVSGGRSTEPSPVIVHENETYTTRLLPGFELELKTLLAEADKWED